MEQGLRLKGVVEAARARLARTEGRKLVRRWAFGLLAVAALAAMARPWVWPSAIEEPLWIGAPRALALGVVTFVAGLSIVSTIGRRRRPSGAVASRAVDAALGLPDIVATADAFARGIPRDPFERLALQRAEESLHALDVKRLLPLPRPLPRRFVWIGTLVLSIGVGLGACDATVYNLLANPPTAEELAEAEAFERHAAEVLGAFAEPAADPASPTPDPAAAEEAERRRAETQEQTEAFMDHAREAARSARRGDRQGTLRSLESLRELSEAQSSRNDELSRALRELAQSLEETPPNGAGAGAPPPSGMEPPTPGRRSEERRQGSREAPRAGSRAGDPSKGAREATEKLLSKMSEGASGAGMTPEERERVLERLSRATESMRAAKSQGGAGERGARRFEEAASALREGDMAAAAKALEAAAAEVDALARERRAAAQLASAMSALLEETSGLERATQLAMLGREGGGPKSGSGEEGSGQGASPGEGLSQALARRLAALGMDPSSASASNSGTGPASSDRYGAPRRSIPVDGTEHAGSIVADGKRAVEALQGLGADGTPTRAYQDVFPGYAASAEDALVDEAVPAARRAVVRRYFEAIRPGAELAETEPREEP